MEQQSFKKWFSTQSLHHTEPNEKDEKLGLTKDFEKKLFWVECNIDLNEIDYFDNYGMNISIKETETEENFKKFVENSTLVYLKSGCSLILNITYEKFLKIINQ